MKILVCISNVPDTTTKINFKDENTEFEDNGVQFVVNPYDEIALTRAVELAQQTQGHVTLINVGLQTTEPVIRKALASGADEAIRVNAAPRDAWFVANQIASVAKQGAYDLILTGRESIDYNGTQVASLVGELLQIPSVSIARKIERSGETLSVEREIEGGKEVLELPLPAIIGATEGMAEPKIPNIRNIMAARSKPLHISEPVDVEQQSRIVSFEKPAPRGSVTFVDADEPEKLLELLHTQARVI